MENWIRDYLRLVLKVDKSLNSAGFLGFLDTYYGPVEHREQVRSESDQPLMLLFEHASLMLEQLPELGFETKRAILLEKSLRTIQALCNQYSGKPLDFMTLVKVCLDIEPSWIPDDEFQRSLELLDAGLPGTRDLRTRFQAWNAKMQVPTEKSELVLPLAKEILGEARRRTNRIVELPQEESIELVGSHGINYGAANWYLGGYHSRMELNMDRPVNLFGLVYQMCHEGYPGHHTEWTMKEKTLFHERGYQEQSVFCLGPQLTIAEGIASLGMEMIFTVDEVEAWMVEMILPAAGIPIEGFHLDKIIEASKIISLDDLSSNLAIMRQEGRSRKEIIEYALAFTPYSEEQVRMFISWLESPQALVYSFSYSHGKRLIQPFLQQPNRNAVIRRLLTEAIYPSGIEDLNNNL